MLAKIKQRRIKTKLDTARITVLATVSFLCLSAIAIPLAFFLREQQTVGYQQLGEREQSVAYNSYLPSAPALTEYPNATYASYIEAQSYDRNADPGTKGQYVDWMYRKVSGDGPDTVRLRVRLTIVKGTAVPETIAGPSLTVAQGATSLPVLLTLPNPKAGYLPWSATPTYELSVGGPVTEQLLPVLTVNTVFTATYSAKVDTDRYEDAADLKYVVTYTIKD